MRLTVATEDGSFFNLDVDGGMELENLKALLEAESGLPTDDQLLFFAGRQLTDDKESLSSYNVKDDDMLLLRQKSADPSNSASGAGPAVAPAAAVPGGDDIEAARLRLLGNPQQMAQLRRDQPELANAITSNPTRFRELMTQFQAMQQSAALQRQHETELLHADPFDVEAQRKIEEAIRQEAVLENMETAMESMPEAFGSVHMLYVNTEVNGHAVKAFVDSGAQATIMSPGCAEKCGIMRLLDTRFAGMARGVGTAKILGRVHSAQLKMGKDLYLQCSFTIMEGKDVDLLFGLDMLKRHQATIDLGKDALVIQGREIRFLSEHELPKHSQEEEEYELDAQGNPVAPRTSSSASASASTPSTTTSSSSSVVAPTPFPGAGQTLSSPSPTPTPTPASTSGGGVSEEALVSLIGLGFSRQQAVSALVATGGNVEMAAGLLFSS